MANTPNNQCVPCTAPLAGLTGRCSPVFSLVAVSYLQRGGTTVHWDLLPTFVDPRPYTFQLQVGQTVNPDADDWRNVGAPVEDVFYMVDPEQRNFAILNRTAYRVKLTTPVATYYSDPTNAAGTLAPRDWKLAREILRKELLGLRKGPGGQKGTLLKRRITGEDCPTCLDHLTEEITDPSCPDCFGTGKRCGYYYPYDCVWAALDPKTYRTHLDAGQARGTINDIVIRARMINTWFLGEEDVWINDVTDDRYFVHTVQNVIELRGVPLVANVELRPAPATSVIYSIAVA